MIDIAISAIAWASLTTPLGIAAGLGWMRCARLLAAEKTRLANAKARAEHYRTDWLDAIDAFADYIDSEPARLSDHMRDIGRKGNESRIAQQAAAKEARRLELEQNIADRAALPAPDWMQAA